MKRSHFFPFCLLVLSFFSCGQGKHKPVTQISTDTASELLVSKLQGEWTCNIRTIDNSDCKDTLIPLNSAPVTEVPGNKNWLVQRDSIWEFEYPCTLHFAHSFTVKSDSLYFDNNNTAFAHIALKQDKLVITSKKNLRAPRMIETFERDSFNLSITKKLMLDSVNMACLTGSFKLITKMIPDDEAPYAITFPVEMPKLISIPDKRSTDTLYRGKIITLRIGDQERTFHVEAIEWNSFDGSIAKAMDVNWVKKTSITIRPGEWWKGEPFEARYVKE